MMRALSPLPLASRSVATEALIPRESSLCLARIGGTDPDLQPMPRRQADSRSSSSTPLPGSTISERATRGRVMFWTTRAFWPFITNELVLSSHREGVDVLGALNSLPQALVAC